MIDFSALGDTLVAAYGILLVAGAIAMGIVSHVPETRPQRQRRYAVSETVPIKIVRAVRDARKETTK